MIDYKKLFLKKSYSLNHKEKISWFFENIKYLSKYHYQYSEEYKKISKSIFKPINKIKNIDDLPFLHSSLFKNFNLKSNKNKILTKSYTSSGTSNSNLSIVNIDLKTAYLQSIALKKIFLETIYLKPEIIFFIEKKNFLKSSASMSARGAAIKGFSQLCSRREFLLKNDNSINFEILKNLSKYTNNKPFIIFGFTNQLWELFVKKLINKNFTIERNKGIVIHGGGWKKMKDKSIKKNIFYKYIKKYTGIETIHDYYGMVEQTGSIYPECEKGFFHTSIFSDIILRDEDLNPMKEFEKVGIIQSLSLLPTSYPGHNILTEDLGILKGIDNCKCGRLGKYFLIEGRVKNTDLRGCSDAI